MHPRLAETMTFVEEKRRDLLKSVEGVEGERLCRRAATDGWSVAEILEHLRMVEAGGARLITKRGNQARQAGLSQGSSPYPVLPSVHKHGRFLPLTLMQYPSRV